MTNEVQVETPDGLTEEQVVEAIKAANNELEKMPAKQMLVARMWFEESTDALMSDPTYILLLGNHAKHGTAYEKLEKQTLRELMQGML